VESTGGVKYFQGVRAGGPLIHEGDGTAASLTDDKGLGHRRAKLRTTYSRYDQMRDSKSLVTGDGKKRADRGQSKPVSRKKNRGQHTIRQSYGIGISGTHGRHSLGTLQARPTFAHTLGLGRFDHKKMLLAGLALWPQPTTAYHRVLVSRASPYEHSALRSTRAHPDTVKTASCCAQHLGEAEKLVSLSGAEHLLPYGWMGTRLAAELFLGGGTLGSLVGGPSGSCLDSQRFICLRAFASGD